MIDWRHLLIELPFCAGVCAVVDRLDLPIIPVILICGGLILIGFILYKIHYGDNRKNP